MREETYMKKKLAFSLAIGVALAGALGASPAVATMCTPTGFIRDGINLTAAVIADGDISGQTINAAEPLPHCNIGIYYGPGTSGTVESSEVYGANYFGIVVTGEDSSGNVGTTSVDVTNNNIHDIGETPPNGTQHGVGVYYFASSDGASATGAISGNVVSLYQKGGIVANGPNAAVSIGANTVKGRGPIPYIAQNGIQIGRGGAGMIMRNLVTGNSYTGPAGASSSGILIFGGCGSDLTTGVRIVKNVVGSSTPADGNDIGVALANYGPDPSCMVAPTTATNNKVINNTITNTELTNNSGNGATGYQAGVYVSGDNDKVINNDISGTGYDPSRCSPLEAPRETCAVDSSSGLLIKNHANSFGP
jgi:hypothetical protein